jgi:predicted Zn-dependent protease
MYSREEVKVITDKVMNMTKADGIEVEFSGGERSATRFANSNITANMVQFDRNLSITVYKGSRSATSSTREFDDASLTQAVEDVEKRAETARENPHAAPWASGLPRSRRRAPERCEFRPRRTRADGQAEP